MIKQRVIAYLQLMRWHRPKPLLLLLWPTLTALMLAAGGMPQAHLLMIFVAGVLVMRAAGCVINDYADRHYDGSVSRTAKRPLAAGTVSAWEAIFLTIFLCSIGLWLVLLLNAKAIILASIALLLAILYPFTKRFFAMPQVVLGLSWYLGIPMAYAAVTNTVPWQAWFFYLIVVLWTVVYDSMYAMADREEDSVIGLKSSAILFAGHDRLAIMLMQLLMLILLVTMGWACGLIWPYYMCLVFVAAHFTYQQKLLMARTNEHYIRGFINNTWVGFWIFFGVALSYF